jgi:hypothetical protein
VKWKQNLQTGTVDGLHVDGELTTLVRDDHDSNRATTRLESLSKTSPEVGLIDDRKVLLDITSLGHGNDNTILEIKDSVLLEDWTEHGLDDNTWAWVGDEGRLFMQLLGEEINTQVSVLASGSRGGNSDDLARTSLKDQEITETNVVTWDGDSVGSVGWLGGGGTRTLGAWSSYGNVNLFPINMVVMMTSKDTISSTVETVTEGMMVTIFIIVTHLGFGDSRTVYGFLRDARFFTNTFGLVAAWFDGLFREVNLFSDWLAEAWWWINSRAGDTNLFGIG